MLARLDSHSAQRMRNAFGKHFCDQRGFSAAAYPGYDRKGAKGNRRIDMF